MVALVKDRISYLGGFFAPDSRGRLSKRLQNRSINNSTLVPKIDRKPIIPGELPQRGFPELPKPHSSLPRRPYLDPRKYARPDSGIKPVIPFYKGFSERLVEEKASEKQINIWKSTFTYLEEQNLPTRTFSDGFIDLVRAGANEVELQVYALTAESVLANTKDEDRLKETTAKSLDIIQRKDLPDCTRSRLLLSEQIKTLKENGIQDTGRLWTILKILGGVGLKLLLKLVGL